MKLYKIRNKDTGEYALGGTSLNRWSKGEKTWSNIGHIKNHLHGFDFEKYNPYINAEIIEIELNEINCFSYDINKLINQMKDNAELADKKYAEANLRYLKEKELKLLKELKEKYE